MNRTQQIRKAPKFMAYLDTASDYKGKFNPTDKMIKRTLGSGMTPVFYVELEATELLGAITEAEQYKQDGVYLVDILQKMKNCDEYGYVGYEHILRCRSHGFYDTREEDGAYWTSSYNPDLKAIA